MKKVIAIMQCFVALQEQGNYSFVGRCKYKQHDSVIAKFSCETNFTARHEYMTLASLGKYHWFPKCVAFHEDICNFTHPNYTYPGPKEVCFFQDIGLGSISMYSFLKHRGNRKHVMDSAVVQTVGAICTMHNEHIVHNDLHTNNILIRQCEHDVVIYRHSHDPNILACTPTYGIEPVIIDMGMAKHITMENNNCLVGEYHTHLGMSISGNDMDSRFDSVTMLLNTIPVYSKRSVACDHLTEFVKGVTNDFETGRPCDDSFNSLHTAIFNTIPGKLITADNQMLLLDAAFLARASVPLRRYQEGINLHFMWREFYELFFDNNSDPLLTLKEAIKHMFRVDSHDIKHYAIRELGKAMASITVRINARNNRAKKRLYKNVHWSEPIEMLVLMASNKNMQTKTAQKIASLSDASRVMIYETDTGKTSWTVLHQVRRAINDYISMASKVCTKDITSRAVLLKMMYRSEHARGLVENVLRRQFQTQYHTMRQMMYEHLLLVSIYTLIIMVHIWKIAVSRIPQGLD